jgi:hypothetical protein
MCECQNIHLAWNKEWVEGLKEITVAEKLIE